MSASRRQSNQRDKYQRRLYDRIVGAVPYPVIARIVEVFKPNQLMDLPSFKLMHCIKEEIRNL